MKNYSVTTTSGNDYVFEVEKVKESCYRLTIKDEDDALLSLVSIDYETISIFDAFNKLIDVYYLPLLIEQPADQFTENLKNVAENAIIAVYNERICEKREKIDQIIAPYLKKDA